jgi:hypothetical protein
MDILRNKYMPSDLGTIISHSEMHRTPLFQKNSKLLPFALFFSLEINGQKDTRWGLLACLVVSLHVQLSFLHANYSTTNALYARRLFSCVEKIYMFNEIMDIISQIHLA